MTDQPTYYELLDVSPKATQDEIKAAFRQNAFRNHPDQGGNPALFRILQDAYSTLTSPTKREEYDVWLASVGVGTPPGGVHLPDDAFEDHTSTYWADDNPTYFDREPREESEQEHPIFTTAGAPSRGGRFANRQNRVLSDTGFLTRHGAFVLAMSKVGLVAWIVIALATGRALVPGMGNSTLLLTLVILAAAWIFTSLVLRCLGWGIVIYAIAQAQSGQVDSPWTTAQRLVLGFFVWLMGQWVYVFRHGKWHSLIAFIVMRRWRGWLRPDRRFSPGFSQAGRA